MNTISKFITAILFVGVLGSCKKEFDSPPGPSDPQIVPNKTIAQLKAMHTTPGAYDVITDDIIISGVVIADDRAGNLYKQLFIRDESGALQILLDAASLYGNYPVGRKIFIKCKDLCISDYNRMMQLGIKATVSGAPSVQGIPSNTISNYVIGGSLNNAVTPKAVSFAELGGTSVDMQHPLLGDLIQLNDYEFVNPMNTYADTSVYKKDQNDTLQNCTGSKIIMRTSGYARFAAARVKQGNGNIAAIYTIFQSGSSGTKQLLLRDTSDITFTNGRCGAPPVGSIIYIDEKFETQTANASAPYLPVTIAGWQNSSETGTRTWDARTFSSDKYAYLSGFGAGGPVKTWLVTKAINRTTATTTLTFATKQNFYLSSYPGGTPVPSTLKIMTSTNYTGTGNPWAAGVTWTDISSQATFSPGTTTGTSAYPSAYTPSGNISLNGSGNIYVAFVYEGDDPAGTSSDKTSAWEIDNIRVLGL